MKTALSLIVILCLVIIGYLAWGPKTDENATVSPSPTASPSASTTPEPTSDIEINSPVPGATISSPLVLTGSARGTWYFEASFPVKLYNSQGVLIAQTPAQAQGEWMTTNFVPFSATLVFNNPGTPTGMLVFEKDNPSGLPEHAASVSFEIKFQ